MRSVRNRFKITSNFCQSNLQFSRFFFFIFSFLFITKASDNEIDMILWSQNIHIHVNVHSYAYPLNICSSICYASSSFPFFIVLLPIEYDFDIVVLSIKFRFVKLLCSNLHERSLFIQMKMEKTIKETALQLLFCNLMARKRMREEFSTSTFILLHIKWKRKKRSSRMWRAWNIQ